MKAIPDIFPMSSPPSKECLFKVLQAEVPNWYGMSSDPLVETDAAGNNPTEFIFFNGKRIARRDSVGAISYFFADHLGTARLVISATGIILDDSDFYPFGG
jgi:hypothetical protein